MHTDQLNTQNHREVQTQHLLHVSHVLYACMYVCSSTSCAHWYLLCCRDQSKYWQSYSSETVTAAPTNCISLQCTGALFDCLFVPYSSLRLCKGHFKNVRGCCLHEAIASPLFHSLHITNIRTMEILQKSSQCHQKVAPPVLTTLALQTMLGKALLVVNPQLESHTQ